MMKRNSILLFMFACCLLVIATGLKAQTVNGKLVDEQKQPLAFANVVLQRADSSYIAGTITDEEGVFKLENADRDARLVHISFVGYLTVCKEITGGDMGVIKMMPDARILGEVVVKGYLPKTQIKGNAMVTGVEGTVLEKAGTAGQLLDHIPNVKVTDGSVEVFGSGVVVIYVNGRKMRNPSELDQLASDNIKQVEVVNNPGARYDADVKAVIHIVTRKPQGEGFGFSNRTYVARQWDWMYAEQFDFNYRAGRLDLTGRMLWQDDKGGEKKEIAQDTYLENHWHQASQAEADSRMRLLNTMLSLNYRLGNDASWGMRYDFSRKPEDSGELRMETEVARDGERYEHSSTVTVTDNRATQHNLNLYYTGKVKDLTIDFNADGLWSDSRLPSRAREEVMACGTTVPSVITVSSHTLNENRLYAARLQFTHPLAGGLLSFGSEYSYTSRGNRYTDLTGLLDNDDSEIKDNALSGFMEYSHTYGQLQVQAGLRYEHITSDYSEQGKPVDEQSRTYDNLFPSLSLSLPVGKVRMQLSYRASTERPTYWQLRSNVAYANRYTYEGGNPLLQPVTIRKVSLHAAYRWVTFSADFMHLKNSFANTFVPYADDPKVGLLTFKQFAPYNRFNLSLMLSPTIGRWTPRWGVQMLQYGFPAETPQGGRRMDNPLAVLSWYNALKLPEDLQLHVDMGYATGGDVENTSNRSTWRVDASIYKSFMNDRLSLQLQAEDLFQSHRQYATLYTGSRVLGMNTEARCRIGLTVRYKFNVAKSNYKGMGAGESQKKRM